jgi:hypothetical protein
MVWRSGKKLPTLVQQKEREQKKNKFEVEDGDISTFSNRSLREIYETVVFSGKCSKVVHLTTLF